VIESLSTHVAVLTVVAGLAACTPINSPLDNPVEGARSVTEWAAEQPIQAGPFGQGADSPDAILEMIREMEGGRWVVGPEDTMVGLIGETGDDSVIGYARTTLPPSDHALRAVDVRLDLRNQDGVWLVVSTERRYHCDAEVASELCQ